MIINFDLREFSDRVLTVTTDFGLPDLGSSLIIILDVLLIGMKFTWSLKNLTQLGSIEEWSSRYS